MPDRRMVGNYYGDLTIVCQPPQGIQAGFEPLADKWAAFGWHVQRVDGNDLAAVIAAFDTARNLTEAKPRVILCDTLMGKGVPFLEHMLDQIARHGLIDLEIVAKGDLHIDAHHTVDGCTEIESDHLSAGGALNAWIFSCQAITVGQAALVQLENKVTAAILVGNRRAGNMKTPMFIGGDDQAAYRHQANSVQAHLALVLPPVQISIVEHFADHISAIKVWVRDDLYAGLRYPGKLAPGDGVILV